MKSSNEWFKTASLLCGEIRSGDGVNPRYDSRGSGRKSGGYKLNQMCKEARKVLSSIFQGETVEPILSWLQIANVEIEGEGQFLTVTITNCEKDLDLCEEEVKLALARAKGYLRTEIAQTINRKRIPMLKFKYIGNLN